MNLGYVNSMAANLVAVYWIAEKVKLVSSAYRDDLPNICRLALSSKSHANAQIVEAAAKLIKALESTGVNIAEQAKVVPTAPAAVTPEPAPVVTVAPSLPVSTSPPQPPAASLLTPAQAADWRAIELFAVDLAGPMAAKMVKRIAEQNSGKTPRAASSAFVAIFGEAQARAIFARYKGQ